MFCFVVTSFEAQAQETQFFDSLYDVPVMPELVEIKDMALSFDKPHGRIAYAGALSSVELSSKNILDFYKKSLPQMGWNVLKNNEYQRESEMLRISIVRQEIEGQHRELVQFMLFPAHKP